MVGTIPALGERTTRCCRGGMSGLVAIGLILFFLPARLPAASPATDFFYRIRGGQVHITGYRGPGGDITIPERIEGRPVTRIESSQAWEKATRVVIPDSVQVIEGHAFSRGEHLTEMVIGKGVQANLRYRFGSNPRLHSITVSEDNLMYASLDGVLFDKELQTLIRFPTGRGGSYIIPDSVTHIGVHAFMGNSILTEVTIPDGVTVIPNGAFSGCSGLARIHFGNRVSRIEKYAFSDCAGLSELRIPESVESIGFSAFQNGAGLSSLTIPSNVVEIGGGAFAGCTGLTSIDVAPNNPAFLAMDGIVFSADRSVLVQYPAGRQGSYDIPDHVTHVAGGAFKGVAGLTGVAIPDTVMEIGPWAFSGCTELKDVEVGGGVRSISFQTFSGCTALPHIVLPDSVTHMGESAFQNCSGLVEVTFERGVEEIGDRAFLGCAKLERVILPESLAHVGAYAFFDCTGLRSIVFRGDAPEVGPEWLRGTDNVTLYRRARTKGWPARGEPWGGQPRVRRRINRYLLPKSTVKSERNAG